jgi:hypothetical protein
MTAPASGNLRKSIALNLEMPENSTSLPPARTGDKSPHAGHPCPTLSFQPLP